MNQEFDEYKEEYSESISSAVSFSGQSHDFFTKRKAENLIEIIRSEMSRHQHPNILDVGCGHGLIHPYLIQNFEDKISLTAVDIASEVIELARKHNPNVRYDSYDGDTLPYQDNTFTLAFAICVVHHVPSEKWASFLKQMQRVVKKDGLVVIMEHNPNNPLTVRIVKNHPFDKNAVLIKNKKLKSILFKNGLVEVFTKFIIFTSFDNKFFRWLDDLFSQIPLGAQYITKARKQ